MTITSNYSNVYPGNPVITADEGHVAVCVGYNHAGTPLINGHTRDVYHQPIVRNSTNGYYYTFKVFTSDYMMGNPGNATQIFPTSTYKSISATSIPAKQSLFYKIKSTSNDTLSIKFGNSNMKIYLEKDNLIIRDMIDTDANAFIKAFKSYGWNNEIETYIGYFNEQLDGIRKVYVAEYENKVAGFCTLILKAQNGPWKNKLPEISDLRVFNEFKNKGIGNLILDIIELDTLNYSDEVTLAVGLHYEYGNAQRIYAKRGYIPDGTGVWYEDENLKPYENCCNNDSLLLYMSKKLR